jgi:hypothetical protein
MTNLYEVTYKTSAKARSTQRAIRCAAHAQCSGLTAALIQDGAVLVSIRLVGEMVGPWSQIGGAA